MTDRGLSSVHAIRTAVDRQTEAWTNMQDETAPQAPAIPEPVKAAWVAPAVSRIRAGEAESGNNVSENAATGS